LELAEALYLHVEAGAQQLVEGLVQTLAVPGIVHIRLPETERALTQDPVIEGRVVHLDVPGSVAVEPHID